MIFDSIRFVQIDVPVRYDEEDIPNNFPFRKNDMLSFTVEHPSGKIIGFPTNYKFPNEWVVTEFGESRHDSFLQSHIFNLGMKVTDNGTYTILDNNKTIISTLEQEYVPDSYSIPGEDGDYLNFNINFSTGVIENWYGEKATFREFS